MMRFFGVTLLGIALGVLFWSGLDVYAGAYAGMSEAKRFFVGLGLHLAAAFSADAIGWAIDDLQEAFKALKAKSGDAEEQDP